MRPRTRGLLAAATAVLLAGGLTQAIGETARAAGTSPAAYKAVRAQVFTVPGVGTVAIGMPNRREVKIQHLDQAAGSWSRPRLLFDSGSRRTCGEIDGITSPGGIALTIHCDTSYAEDQAPAKSEALVSADFQTWENHTIPGESYRPPGISPSGNHAVWAADGGSTIFRWGAEEGFNLPRHPVGHDFDTGGLALVVDDKGTATVAGPDSADGRCVLGLYSRTLGGATSRQQVDLAPGAEIGCTELAAYGRSSTRIFSGPYVGRAGRWVIGRADESSPWALLERAPNTAPGLVDYRGSSKRVMHTTFSDVAGQPLLALGSPDRRRVTVQTYDQTAQSWGPSRIVYDHGFPGCTWGSGVDARTSAVHSLLMHCYPKRRPGGDYPPYDDDYDVAPARSTRVLLSSDGRAWRSIAMGGHPVTTSPDRTLVAAGRAKRTTIASRHGFTDVAAGAPGRCEAVVPIGQRRLLRLNATPGSRGYPTALQRLTSKGWKTIHRIPDLGQGRCQRVVVSDFGVTGTFAFVAVTSTKGVRIRRAESGWRAVVVRGY